RIVRLEHGFMIRLVEGAVAKTQVFVGIDKPVSMPREFIAQRQRVGDGSGQPQRALLADAMQYRVVNVDVGEDAAEHGSEDGMPRGSDDMPLLEFAAAAECQFVV